MADGRGGQLRIGCTQMEQLIETNLALVLKLQLLLVKLDFRTVGVD